MDTTAGSPELDPGTSPRFQRAASLARSLASDATWAGLAAALLLVGSWATASLSPTSIWPTFFGANAAALILYAAGLRAAYEVADWRRQQAGLARLPAPAWFAWVRGLLLRPWRPADSGEAAGQEDRIERWGGGIAALGAAGIRRLGPRAASLAALALLALIVAFSSLSFEARPPAPGGLAYSIAGIALLTAFWLLVAERRLGAVDADAWPEAAPLMLLARLPIVTLSLSSLALLMTTTGYAWPAKLPALAACLSILVGLEFLVRAVLAMFAPPGGDRQPPLMAESLVAGGLRWPPRPLTALGAELRNRHGIDLRQIWAVTFIRRALPAVAAGIVILGWLVSGVIEVPMAGRGIYERFGRPVAVLHPGLHLGLPWPFGRLVPVENGVVHELATSVAGDNGAVSDAEGPAPSSANRLWDATHVSEASQIIASLSGGRQSFQIVNMDIRFVYRIGLSDEAALDAAYRTVDVPAMLEAAASRVLVHDFAVRTLDDVLGEGRVDMADDIARAIRADLDRLHSGVEILAVVVEAIHPPAGAANAYHAVQAAEITAQALVARERGQAAQSANEAQLAATVAADRATAGARENIARSDVSRLQFAAEQTAYQKTGQVFLTEAYFSRLAAGLGQARALILDHRIGDKAPPTFDLRSMMLPIDPQTAGKAGPPGKEVKP